MRKILIHQLYISPVSLLTATVGLCIFLMSGVLVRASELADTLESIFTKNHWTLMNRWAPEGGRVYVRIPNLESGFIPPAQLSQLFQKMENRLDTRQFRISSDTGQEKNRWIVRAHWVVYDKNLKEEFKYNLEVGWESLHESWRLIIIQAQ